MAVCCITSGPKELLLVAILVERDRREAEIISAELQFERETVGETEDHGFTRSGSSREAGCACCSASV